MLDGVNDEEQHAHLLGKLLETFEVVSSRNINVHIFEFDVKVIKLFPFLQVVNLIPFNPIGILSQFDTSGDQKVTNFQKILRNTYNIRTTVRKQMGQDISGACGQLVIKKSAGAGAVTDIEDLHL